ncbi:MAG TPA: c-type cytochrome [Bryobacteraceae bacterium]|nr:c-type cytochrome [Bryobacteraceae bacterium]
MKKISKSYFLAAAIIAALAVSATPVYAQRGPATVGNKPEPTSPVKGNAVAGKKLYYSYGCYACHGYTGETGYRAFVGNWGHLGTDQEFITFLRGRVNVAPVIPSDRMPNFSENVMSNKRAEDIYAYIRTFKNHAAPVKDIPSLSEIVSAAKREKN